MSTSFSSGTGGSIGGSPQPLQRELEASAWTLVNKAALGIVPDSLEIPFTQLGGQLWKYQSDANRPTLKPMGTIRTTLPKDEGTDNSWKPLFKQLVDKLPPEVKEELLKDMERPPGGRSQNFAQLENTLTLTAKSLAWLEGAQKPTDLESPTMDRIKDNVKMPGRALRGTIKQSGNMLEGATTFLNRVGANHVHHDALRHFAEKGAEMHEDLNTLLEVLKNPDAPPPTNEEFTALSDQAMNLLNDFQKVDHGKNLLILTPLFDSMAAVAAALSLTPASPTLYLGLKLATMGLFSSDSESALFGSELAAVIKALQSGQGAALLQKVGLAKLQMLLMSLLGTIGGAATLAALLAEYGIGRFPARNEGDQVAGQRYGLQLMLKLIASSGVMKQLYAIIAAICGGSAKAQDIFSDNMELVTLLLMTMTATKGSPENAGGFIETIRPELEAKLEKSRAFLTDLLTQNGANEKEVKAVDISISQAKIALEKGDIKGIIEALAGALELVNSTPEQLKEDLDPFKELAILLKQSCSKGTSDESAMITALLRAA